MKDALLALADHDEALVRACHAEAHPPSRPAAEAAQDELRGLAAQKRELDVTRVPLQERAQELERGAGQARSRAATIAERLATATGAGRELEAMAQERDHLTARADDLDDELLGVLEALEPLDAADADLRHHALEVTERHRALEASAEQERDEASATRAALEAARPALAAELDPALLARYEAIAARRGGVGAARLVDGRCLACHVTVPSAVEDQLAHGGDDAIAVCDECGRLLVR